MVLGLLTPRQERAAHLVVASLDCGSAWLPPLATRIRSTLRRGGSEQR